MGNETSKKPGNGRSTNKAKEYKPTGRPGVGGITGTMQREPDPVSKTEGHDPKYWKKVMVMTDQGFKKAKWVRKASQSKTPPPSVRAKKEEMAKQPPPVKYASKEPKSTTKYTNPYIPKGATQLQQRRKKTKKGGVS